MKLSSLENQFQKTSLIPLLTLSRPRPISYRNQSIDLLCKSMGWFLYDIGLGRERVKLSNTNITKCPHQEYLVIVLDSKQNFTAHVDEKNKKLQ